MPPLPLVRERGPVTSDRTAERVRDALARPDSYPHRPGPVEVRETHISWVFLAGEFAYKLKKPLVLDFLDYGTAEKRRDVPGGSASEPAPGG